MLFAESTALSAPDPFPQPAESCPPLPAEPPHAADLRCSRLVCRAGPRRGRGETCAEMADEMCDVIIERLLGKSFAGFRPPSTQLRVRRAR